MSDKVVNTVVHTAAQAAAGVVVGGVCEAVFPAPKPLGPDGSGMLMLAGEVVAQLLVNAFAFIATAKIALAADDQTGLLVYSYTLFETQPSLRHKMRYAGQYVTSMLASPKSTDPVVSAAMSLDRSLTQSQQQKMRSRY